MVGIWLFTIFSFSVCLEKVCCFFFKDLLERECVRVGAEGEGQNPQADSLLIAEFDMGLDPRTLRS